ncbi:MAG: long-chain fatty acid--CoA ligase [Aeromicrobium sp.]|jgi:fatty-acyl-CoA synthase|nr:long-chain fatty acid--CoA ligase [Aeromicrobium sp.]
MQGLMQRRQLTLPLILHRAEELFPHSRITFRVGDQDTTVTYATWAEDVRRAATYLLGMGLEPGARVATLCANTYEHLTLYFAVPCSGLVLNTVNHRLSDEHLAYVLEDAGVEAIFVDAQLLEASLPVLRGVKGLRHVVVVGDTDLATAASLPRYHDTRASPPHEGDFAEGDESRASSICYTSGTTGPPKGVVYTHRSLLLHALMILQADSIGLVEDDVVLPIVPMFHANAWGLPYAAVFVGADIVLAGAEPRPESLVDLMVTHDVSVTACVATVWRDMLPFAQGTRPRLRRALSGGGPLSPSLAKEWRDTCGVTVSNTWGMTELAPSGTIARVRLAHGDQAPGADALLRPGTPNALVRLRVGDPGTGAPLSPGDGAVGEIQVSGPTTASSYLGGVGSDRFTADGWLRTGDVGTVSVVGELVITDRLKDVIKSGGEWISTIDLENALMDNPAIAEAAVIGVPDERWDERPLAFVVPRPGVELEPEAVREDLAGRVAKWWIPERIIVAPGLPRNGVGKVSKADLRVGIGTDGDQ